MSRAGRRGSDLWWAGGVGLVLVALDVVLRAYLRRPFWYDEIWRGHFVSEPLGSFWPELARANTPSAAGWVVMERLGGELLGWHTWVLRLPGFVALPLLGVCIVLLTARFTGPAPAAFAALWICLNSTFLDLGTQLKPYTIETLAAVVAVLLWIGGDRGSVGADEGVRGGPDRRRLARRTSAGLVSLFSVPAVFVIAPLAAADVVTAALRAHRAARAEEISRPPQPAQPAQAGETAAEAPRIGVVAAGGRRAVEALPALVLAGANTVLFVGHQSSQRLGHYWDAQFLAGRGLGGGLAFVGRQLWDIVTGTPPGVDRYDPSLLHPPTDGGWAAAWFFAPAVVVCGLVGVALLARRPDGRQLLVALGGAQLAMLAASAVRFWPFGPTRTNLFLVPLIVLVVVTGAAALVRRLFKIVGAGTFPLGRRVVASSPNVVVSAAEAASPADRRPREAEPAGDGGAGTVPRQRAAAGTADGDAPATPGRRFAARSAAAVIALALVAAGAGAQVSSAARDGRLYEQRDRLRGLDLTVDAAIAARRLYQPGDLVVVGGRLLRPGWIYAMETSDDGAQRPAGLPVRSGAREPARIPRADTLFFAAPGQGQVARAVATRPRAPRRILLFVFDLDAAAARADLTDLRRAGWCPDTADTFALTGTLTTLTPCR